MMPKQPKMQHCWNCGDEIGVFIQEYGDYETCNKRECLREAQIARQTERDQRMLDAAEDDYQRY